ncbi:hypothetical protein BH09MYX1_BH09MYX1_13430 [soil metagenome]
MKRSAVVLSFLVLAACGSRTGLSGGTAQPPVAECTWSIVGNAVRVSPATVRIAEYAHSLVDAIPTANGALIAWRTEANDAPHEIVVRRLAWDLVANGDPHLQTFAPWFSEKSVWLADGFEHTALGATTGNVIVRPLSGDGVSNGAPVTLDPGHLLSLRATPSGFDALVGSANGEGTVELVQLDPTGAQLAHTTLFSASAHDFFSGVSGRATLADGSFIATSTMAPSANRIAIVAQHFAANGGALAALRTVATADIDADVSWQLPVVPVPGGALAAWVTRNDVESKLLVRPLSPDAVPQGDAIVLAELGNDAVVRAFDLKADGHRGALAAWVAVHPQSVRTIHLRALTPGGNPIGAQVDLPPIAGLTIDPLHLRVAIDGERGLLVFSAQVDDGIRVHAVRLSCDP